MKWISVKEKLPQHHQTILSATPTGWSVCIFVDGKIMAETIQGVLGHEKAHANVFPYYFCSQEIKGAVLNGVTHWMNLPERPNEKTN